MASPSADLPTVLAEDVRPGVRLLTMNRPERLNAMDHQLVSELHDRLDEVAADPDVRCVILTGAGRGFCAGLDLKGSAAVPGTEEQGRPQRGLATQQHIATLIPHLRSLKVPVIAAVNGPAAGAGFGLALAADIRLVAETATMTAGYVRRGLSPDAGVTYHLPRLIGASRAADVILTGRDVPAAEALHIGLASAVLPAATFAEAVADYAARLAAGPPVALALTKRLLTQSPDATLEAQLRDELTHIKTCFATADVAEAMTAFREKRAPVFRGG